jgi:hypothetical protein
MLPDSGSIRRSVHVWEVQFTLMLSPGWSTAHNRASHLISETTHAKTAVSRAQPRASRPGNCTFWVITSGKNTLWIITPGKPRPLGHHVLESTPFGYQIRESAPFFIMSGKAHRLAIMSRKAHRLGQHMGRGRTR